MGQDVCLIRSSLQSQRFLNYFLHSPAMERQLALLLVGSTFYRINVAEIQALTVVVPPTDEQTAIAAHLDVALEGAGWATADVQREIELLREYRTRLVADVVTGKLDVRGVAARLPGESEMGGQESLDEDAAMLEEPEESEGADSLPIDEEDGS
jgi:type I restriction enzyme S subunit